MPSTNSPTHRRKMHKLGEKAQSRDSVKAKVGLEEFQSRTMESLKNKKRPRAGKNTYPQIKE